MRAIYVSPNEPARSVRLARRPISEVMSKPPVTVSEGALLEEALTLMIQSGLRHLVVIAADRRTVGILSDRAIAAVWATDYAALANRTVASALEREPALISVRGAVVDAAALMGTAGVDAVAVVDGDRAPVGVITGSDLVALLAN